MKAEKPILGDHTRKGKVLIPPITQLGVFEAISWTGSTMPELLWIGLVFNKFDLKSGVELCLSVSQKAADRAEASNEICFALASAFDTLSPEAKKLTAQDLKVSGEIIQLRSAIDSLVSLYPECPLSFLASSDLPEPSTVIPEFKELLSTLFNKRGRLPVLMQAQAVYTLSASGRLVIQEGSSLGNLDELRFYPSTTESKKVGAGICAACNVLAGQSLKCHDSGWAPYFWRRGFELDDCEYELPY